jgi:hypothetical protein
LLTGDPITRRLRAALCNDTNILEGRANTYLFVVGCPRSGTTLVQRMLDAHPLLTVVNDGHFIPAAVDGLDATAEMPLTAEIVERARTYRTRSGKTGFHRLGLPDAAVEDAAARATTYAEFVSGLYDAVARGSGKPLAGDKTPDYVRHLPLLTALFPKAPVVHLIRDCRSVVLSLMEWAAPGKGPALYALWHQEPVAVCALWWRWQVRAGLRDGRPRDERYREVRYEDLVTDPDAILRRLTGFLGLPFAPQMLGYHEGRQRSAPGLAAKQAWRHPTQACATGARRWRPPTSPSSRRWPATS